MEGKQKQALSVRCPTCGAKPGEKRELGTGQPRTEPHRDRRVGFNYVDKLKAAFLLHFKTTGDALNL